MFELFELLINCRTFPKKKYLDLKKIDRLSRLFTVRDIEFSLFSAQISGFSADFDRKSLDIVKQHPYNAGILADSVF